MGVVAINGYATLYWVEAAHFVLAPGEM